MLAKRIGFLAFESITASHLVAPVDIFAAATLDSGYGNRIPCYQTYTIGLTTEPFRAESGITFTPDETLQTAPELDTIIVPGGKTLRQASDGLSDWLLTRAGRTRRIVAIATGIYGLAPTGLLDGREVTTHWRFASDVAHRFPKLRVNHKRPLVKDGPFYTSSSLSAGIDLSLALIEEDYGCHVALAAVQELGMPLMRPNGHTELSKPLAFDSQPTNRLAELVPWIMRNLHADLSINALARKVCMSPSHFTRAFKSVLGSTPAEFVENLRLNEARRRLSTPKKTIQSVAELVGFSSADEFRRAFEKRFGAKPSACVNDSESRCAETFCGSNATQNQRKLPSQLSLSNGSQLSPSHLTISRSAR
jgi:transcriptional regulator GlxA family with amidase domain